MRLTAKETCQVLAALRFWQSNIDEEDAEELKGYGHFVEHDPLTMDEIDELCEEINCDSSEYVESGGWICPKCKSQEVSAVDKPRSDLGSVTHALACNTCNTRWTEYFELTGYSLENE